MTYLLDVNVLIALMDSSHIEHNRAHEWFDAIGRHSWATSPMTENGALRILSHPNYPNSPGSPAVIAQMLQEFFTLSGHFFWPDDVSLLDPRLIDTSRLLAATQITDSYLLALAVAHEGQLATFDRRLIPDAVHNGTKGLHRIASAFPLPDFPHATISQV
jgi:toxin-antitoxin system PIN domain toxin